MINEADAEFIVNRYLIVKSSPNYFLGLNDVLFINFITFAQASIIKAPYS